MRQAPIQVIFETHSTSTDNENGIASGHADPPLSSLGEEQARQLGLRYTTVQIDAVYCSDLQRSYRTGEIAFATRPTLVTRDARLRECDYGALTCSPASQIAVQKLRRVRAPFRDGESYEDSARRVCEALRDIAQRHLGSTVLVIGHRATQYGLEHWLRGVDLERAVTAPWQWRPGWTYVLTPGQI